VCAKAAVAPGGEPRLASAGEIASLVRVDIDRSELDMAVLVLEQLKANCQRGSCQRSMMLLLAIEFVKPLPPARNRSWPSSSYVQTGMHACSEVDRQVSVAAEKVLSPHDHGKVKEAVSCFPPPNVKHFD